MSDDFNHFVDSVLVEAANRQTDSFVKWLPLSGLCTAAKVDAPPTWVSLVPERIRALGYGELQRDDEKPGTFWFELNGAGLARVEQIRSERRRPTVMERIKAVPRSDWISIRALIVSAVALLK